ncbi:helix-turn-helix transcriptional regulator [Salinimicrobium sp. 3283s]|uniref:helix-turn-helix domain-containing protein n=1 Tax=Salinimicrobium sp. 3283s TaxID=3114359 RepID=UPI0031EF1F65
MKQRNLKITEMAAQMEENPTSVTSYLNGNRKPRVEFIWKVIHFFPEADLNWLFRDDASGLHPSHEEKPQYSVPKTPDTIISNIEGDLKELKALLAQK